MNTCNTRKTLTFWSVQVLNIYQFTLKILKFNSELNAMNFFRKKWP